MKCRDRGAWRERESMTTHPDLFPPATWSTHSWHPASILRTKYCGLECFSGDEGNKLDLDLYGDYVDRKVLGKILSERRQMKARF